MLIQAGALKGDIPFDAACGKLRAQLKQQLEMVAENFCMTEVTLIPAVAQQNVQLVFAGVKLRGDVIGLILNSCRIGCPIGSKDSVTYLFSVYVSVVNSERGYRKRSLFDIALGIEFFSEFR